MAGQKTPLLLESLSPFLYPCLYTKPFPSRSFLQIVSRKRKSRSSGRCWISTATPTSTAAPPTTPNSAAPVETLDQTSHLNPSPSDYAIHPFTDNCTITLQAGHGGHGCVAFLREKYIPEGPPNGGDGGNGGSIFIQAVRGETSLHKLARRPILKAGKGGNGKGKGQGGERGTDVVFTVPVGTVIKEVERFDPVEEEHIRLQEMKRQAKERKRKGLEREERSPEETHHEVSRDKWVRFPGEMKQFDIQLGEKAPPPIRTGTNPLAVMQPARPIKLDLDTPMEKPMLLAAGAAGGLGNPHFVTKEIWKPKFATKGELGIRVSLNLELKVLADVGLVGLPNAGKSTLLRALTNSRTRVGDWSFTTLQPSIGTVVLDNHAGRPIIQAYEKDGTPRDNFTIADIPGLIENAHLDKGLGLGFLRHVERASVLAFVVDLSAGDAVEAVQALWREVTEYEVMRAKQLNYETESRSSSPEMLNDPFRILETHQWAAPSPPISSKPWFVVGTKADLPETRGNFENLKTYLAMLKDDKLVHPSGKQNAWKSGVRAVPVSAIKAEGVDVLPRLIVELLG